MGLWPTQGDEKRLLPETALPWARRPHLCHLDRSAAQWRDLCVDAPFLEMFFDRGVVERSAVSLAGYPTSPKPELPQRLQPISKGDTPGIP